MKYRHWILLFALLFNAITSCISQIASSYYTNKGKVVFASTNALERIEAKSQELKGVLNSSTANFAFVVRVVSFDGFNTALQKDHFNENYLESEKYPLASFQGRLLDDFDFSKDGISHVRAKGVFKIHGMEHEKIIKVALVKNSNTISVITDFEILLSDYDIRIPRIVHGKISPEIKISVNADLVKK